MLNITKTKLTMEQTVIKAELHKAFVFLLETLSLKHRNSTFTTESIDAINEVTDIIAESNLNPKKDYNKELSTIQRIISKHILSIIDRELTELIVSELNVLLNVFKKLDVTYVGGYYYNVEISTGNYSYKGTIAIKDVCAIMHAVNDLYTKAKHLYTVQRKGIQDI